MVKVTSTKGEYRTYESPEEWRDVVGNVAGWPYKVSNWGRVMSFHIFHGRPPRLHGARLSHDGYLYVKLRCDGEIRYRKVHQLVAEAFLGLRPPGLVVNHKTSCKDRQDNRPEKLEWTTVSGNTQHGWDNGRKSKLQKLTAAQAEEIRSLYARGMSMYKIAKSGRFNVSESVINNVIAGRSYKTPMQLD